MAPVLLDASSAQRRAVVVAVDNDPHVLILLVDNLGPLLMKPFAGSQ